MLLVSVILFKLTSEWKSVIAHERGHAGQLPHTLSGDIRLHRDFHSRFLPGNRDIIVYLPPGYEKDQSRRYPAFYLQDGQNIFDAATSFFPGMERHLDERAEALIKQKTIRPLIIVGIYSTGLNRINDYTPTKLPGTYMGGEADLYARL